MAAFNQGKKSRVKRAILAEARRRKRHMAEARQRESEQARQNMMMRRADAEGRMTTMDEVKRRARDNMTLRTAAGISRMSGDKYRNIYTRRSHPLASFMPAAQDAMLSGAKSARALTMSGKPGYHGTSIRKMSSRPTNMMLQFLSRRPPMPLTALSRSHLAAETKTNRLRRNLFEANEARSSPRRVKSLNRHKRKTKSKSKSKRSA